MYNSSLFSSHCSSVGTTQPQWHGMPATTNVLASPTKVFSPVVFSAVVGRTPADHDGQRVRARWTTAISGGGQVPEKQAQLPAHGFAHGNSTEAFLPALRQRSATITRAGRATLAREIKWTVIYLCYPSLPPRRGGYLRWTLSTGFIFHIFHSILINIIKTCMKMDEK